VIHLIFIFYLFALVAGTAALSQTFVIWQRYRTLVITRYGFFQLAMYFILLSFMVGLYARTASLSGNRALENIVWILQAIGGLTYIIAAPYFYHSLLGLSLGRWKRVLFFVVDAAAVAGAVVDLAFPSYSLARILLSGTLFAMIAYGLVLIAVKLHAIADPILKRAMAVFLGLSVVFFPLMYIDSALSYTQFLRPFQFLDNLSLPAYFLILNCLTIVFGLRYMNRPAYIEKNNLTPYFLSTYHSTDREREIIGSLLDGAGSRRIAEALFISEKTVENHIYNIYQKLRVRNRVQMFQLIRTNSIE
jgi:DNA-binding CsgD family transcriptional regulator